MARDYAQDAAAFVSRLRDPGPLPAPLPSAQSIADARIGEFPFVEPSILARSSAIQARFGELYFLGFGLGSSKVDRAAQTAQGFLVIYNGTTVGTQKDVFFKPGVMSFEGASFKPGEEDAFSAHLDEVLTPFYS